LALFRVRKLGTSQEKGDFTDSSYQSQLPLYARSTASQAIKNNIAITELTTEPDRIVSKQKAQTIVDHHVEHRRQEREIDPGRFGIKSLGQSNPRHATGRMKSKSMRDATQLQSDGHDSSDPSTYKEVEISQPSKASAS
jgi:hypothetical protein